MKPRTIILLCMFCSLGAFCLVSQFDQTAVAELYKSDLRGAFFVAFLTLGGFLLSLKTFIVVKMKELLYDSPSYIDRLKIRRRLKPQATHYGTLKNLSDLLFWSILLCFGVSVLQFTIGLCVRWWAVGVCVAAAACAVCLLVISLIITRQNLRDMFKRAEEDSLRDYPASDVGGPVESQTARALPRKGKPDEASE